MATKKHITAGIKNHQLIFTSDNLAAFCELPNSEKAVIAITATLIRTKTTIRSGFFNIFHGVTFASPLFGVLSAISIPGRTDIRIFFY